MELNSRKFLLLFLIFVFLPRVYSESILFLYVNASPSHKNIGHPIMVGLADRGHNITVVSPFRTERHRNIHDIIPIKEFDYFPRTSALDFRRWGQLSLLTADYGPMLSNCHKVYNNREFMGLLDRHFDLVLMDAFANECLLGFVHKLGAPFIYISPLPVPDFVSMHTGNRLPPSFVPHPLTPYNHRMNLFQRTTNVILAQLFAWGARLTLSLNEAVYRKYLGAHMPGVDQILANLSMQFVNSHFSFNFPRPTMPDIVEIGGVHCRPGRPIPKDLDEFLSGSKDGFILFSLGSIVKPYEMPEETRKVFLNVFSRLKQRVLWKWPTDMPDLPPNVKLLKWVPQQDVLAHPNIRLFMTHSGLLSTQEAIYHGVPVVSVPVFWDQDKNAHRAVEEGIGDKIEILGLTEKELETAVYKVLNNTKYRERVKVMSTYLRDQTDTPQERAVFWAEYVMRHKGAYHLRSAARELSFFQYYSLDVACIIFLLACPVIYLLFLLCRKLVQNSIDYAFRIVNMPMLNSKSKVYSRM